MKKRVLATLAVMVLSVSMLAGCASEDTEENAEGGEEKEPETITIVATPTPHAEILDHIKDTLAEEGYDLQVNVQEDYVLPNELVESEEADANYFQHIEYLDNYNEEKGTHLVNAGGIHYEPFGIYPGTKKDLEDIADGDTIAVPNDTTNEARALLLLQDNGLLTLKEGAGLTATVNDIEENPFNLDIRELEAAQIPRVMEEVSFVVLNGNYAMEAGLSVGNDAIAVENADSEAVQTYVNVIAVKEGHEDDPKIVALVNVLRSDEVQKWIEEEYDGAVVPYTE